MINLQPIEWAKLAAILAVLAYGWYIWDSRADYRAEADALKAQVSLYQAKEAAAVADAARKQSAYADAKRKADNDAKDLLGRIAWLKKQQGKGCESAVSMLKEYRGAK